MFDRVRASAFLALAVASVFSLAPMTGCGGDSEVKKEMKNTVVNDEAKSLQNAMSSKRKAERDFGKGKGKTASGEDVSAGSGK